MEKADQQYWQKIENFIQGEFHIAPEIHNIIFMIGIQELGYGFQQLNVETKTKVINFATIFILKYLTDEDRKQVKMLVENGEIEEIQSDEEIYKFAIINYFRDREII